MAPFLIEDIQAFIYQYNLRGCPAPSATSLLGLPGLRPGKLLGFQRVTPSQSVLLGGEHQLEKEQGASQPQDGLLGNEGEKGGGLWQILGLQQKVVLQLSDR